MPYQTFPSYTSPVDQHDNARYYNNSSLLSTQQTSINHCDDVLLPTSIQPPPPTTIQPPTSPVTPSVNRFTYNPIYGCRTIIASKKSSCKSDQDYFKHYNQLKSYQAHCHNAYITDSKLNNILRYSINPKMLSKNYRYVLSNLLTFPKWAWSFDRSIASKIFPMPENLPFEDVWINLIIKKNSNKIYHINEPIYKYRQHNNQTFGGILNFDKEKVIFRANRIKNLLQIIKDEPKIMNGIEKK